MLAKPPLQHTASQSTPLHYAATRCNTLRHATINVYIYTHIHMCTNAQQIMATSVLSGEPPLQRTATHCNALQHTATHCNTLQRTATHDMHIYIYIHVYIHTYIHQRAANFGSNINAIGRTATATHCNTLQYIYVYIHEYILTHTYQRATNLCGKISSIGRTASQLKWAVEVVHLRNSLIGNIWTPIFPAF